MLHNDSLKSWQVFIESLKSKIYDMQDSIPLQKLCPDGVARCSEDFEISDFEIRAIEDRNLHGRFKMPFREVSKTGCDKVAWTDDRVAKIDFVFDTISGELTFIEDELRSLE